MTIERIIRKIYRNTKTSADDWDSDDLLDAINDATAELYMLIMQADGTWQIDDSNQGDLPIATSALVSGQRAYSLDVSHIRITAVEVKDQNGLFRMLDPIDARAIAARGESITEYMNDTGTPEEYDKLGASVLLTPIPDYSQADSLKLHFQRPNEEFTAADVTAGTKEPGFNSQFHWIIPDLVTYEFEIDNNRASAARRLIKITDGKAQLAKSFGRREKDTIKRIVPKRIRFR
jgi:hypothetical protein